MSAQSPPWYITRDGQQHGPVADAELKKHVDDGQLQATDFLWRQDFTEWRPAAVLFPQLKAPSGLAAGIQQPTNSRQRPVPYDTEEPRERASYQGPGLATIGIALLCSAVIGAASGYVYKRVALSHKSISQSERAHETSLSAADAKAKRPSSAG